MNDLELFGLLFAEQMLVVVDEIFAQRYQDLIVELVQVFELVEEAIAYFEFVIFF